MGVPRSGTTAITEAINCHPLVFCSMEVFLPTDCHRNISYPQSFQQRLSHKPGEHYRAVKCLLDRKPGATVIGNKHPRYDLRLRKLAEISPDLKLIFIYRDPHQFVNSWNRRAADLTDDSWHPGQRGIFGFLSQLSYLDGLRQIDTDCLIVPYSAFSKDVAGTTDRMTSHLGISDRTSLAGQPSIAELQRAADSLRSHSREVRSNESDFFRAAALQELDLIFDRDAGFLFSEIKQKVDDYLHSIRGLWGQKFLEALVRYDDPFAIQYLRKMLHYRPIAELFAQEAALSPQLARYMRALPRGMKFRRMFLRRNDLTPFERFMHRVQATCAP